MNILSFAVVHKLVAEDSVLSIAVSPLVNGRSVSKLGEFDVSTVVAMGAFELEEMDLFTCSCGTAACAGIFESCAIQLTKNSVCWLLPAETFGESIGEAFERKGNYFCIEFSRAHYEETLTSLRQNLVTLALEKQLPVLIGPVWLNPKKDAWPCDQVEQQLEASRVEYTERLARYKVYVNLWGALLNKRVRIELPSQYAIAVSLPNLCQLVVDAEEKTSGKEKAVLEAEVVAKMHEGDEQILALARTFSWSEIMLMAHGTPNDLPDGESDEIFSMLLDRTTWPDGFKLSVEAER
ncbi:hypothetical protein ACFIQF_04905 [Comamonas sp. J-3]